MSGEGLSGWRYAGEDLKAARASLGIVLSLVAGQAVIAGLGGAQTAAGIFVNLGLSRSGMAEGKVWQLLSYGMLHGNWWHLGVNSLMLLAFGSRVERIGGRALVLRVFAGGVVLGGLGFLLLSPAGGQETYLVGASGGATAMLLWITGVSPGSRMWPLNVSGRSLGWGVLLASALLVVMNPGHGWFRDPSTVAFFNRLGGRHGFSVSHACHLGGGIAGVLAAHWALRPRVTLEQLRKDRARREGAGGARSDAGS